MKIKSALAALQAVGFKMHDDALVSVDMNGLSGYVESQCQCAKYGPDTIRICFHKFKNITQAIDAATALGIRQWPADRKRVSFAIGKTVVEIVGELEGHESIERAAVALKGM